MALPSTIPKHTQVLVVGGGPAGSYTASVLARDGLQVVLLESAQLPRYHVGESLIPSVRRYLKFIDAEPKFVDYGFAVKPGAAFKFDRSKRDGYTDFVELGPTNAAWNVVRADFDKLLLDHARQSGVDVYEQTRVTSIQFSHVDTARPVAAVWTSTSASGETGIISFDFLVDASGRAGLMSTKYLRNRIYNEVLKNIAIWGYWRNGRVYGRNTPREGAPWFESLQDGTGWAWYIPLHDGTTSVGIVVNQKSHNEKGKLLPNLSTESRYREYILLAPMVHDLLAEGELVARPSISGPSGSLDPLVRSASDFSYSADSYAGPSFRIVGDSAAFIDPLFSSGVHLAMTSGLSAAASICASIRGDCSESIAASWHTKRFSLSYTRYQLTVLSLYQVIWGTKLDILDEVNKDDFDQIFSVLRPVLQGSTDMGLRLTEGEIQEALDLCNKIVTVEQPAGTQRQGLPSDPLDMAAPPAHPEMVETALNNANSQSDKTQTSDAECNDTEDGKIIWEVVNPHQVVLFEKGTNTLEVENIDGYAVRLERGYLGLQKVN
ncbi:hypothetical protein J3A83DRAFT_350187 [Scleroderma citrinum]